MRARVFLYMVTMVAGLLSQSRAAQAANPRVEAAAADALRKAENDFLAMNYASGAARLDRALRACAPANCSIGTQAALLRDIGTMEFRAGDRGFAAKAFGEALKLQPGIDLNPSYDSPDLRAAWIEVKGGPAPAPPAPAAAPPPLAASPPPAATGEAAASAVSPPPTFPQPTGDFTHTPAAEQKIDVPLPIYIEGGPAGVTHVVVRYKSPEQGEESEWNHMDLARVSNGWGGTVPCNAVLAGTVRYFIQAYNKDMDPVAANGDAKNPYQVPVREELHGAPPHLPGRAVPRACHAAKTKAEPPPPPPPEAVTPEEPAECPPGMPGCGKVEKAEGDEEEEEKPASNRKKNKSKGPRAWIGVSYALDVMSMPSGDNLCLLYPTGPLLAQPLNNKYVYCTDSAGNDFPTRGIGGDTININLNTENKAGHSDGGIVAGTMHFALALDGAVADNVLVGGRAGITVGAYTGQAAPSDGHASKVPLLYLEARLTVVFGNQPFAHDGLAPVVFGGGGYGEFDGHLSGTAQLPAPPQMAGRPQLPPIQRPVTLWVTSGPFFGVFGAGIRYTAPGLRWVLTGAARANFVTNGAGIIPSYGPDLSVQYGF